jgi:hypothetical protein
MKVNESAAGNTSVAYLTSAWLRLVEVSRAKVDVVALIDPTKVLRVLAMLPKVPAAVLTAAWATSEVERAWLKLPNSSASGVQRNARVVCYKD